MAFHQSCSIFRRITEEGEVTKTKNNSTRDVKLSPEAMQRANKIPIYAPITIPIDNFSNLRHVHHEIQFIVSRKRVILAGIIFKK